MAESPYKSVDLFCLRISAPTLFILTGDSEPFDLPVPCFSAFMRISELRSSSLLFFSNSDSLGMNVNAHWSRLSLTGSPQKADSFPYLFRISSLINILTRLLDRNKKIYVNI